MVNDHEALTIAKFRGLYARGEDDSVPNGFFLDSRNNRFLDSGFKSREGSSSLHTIPAVNRIAIYKRVGEAQRLLILDDSGNLYDSTNLGAPILTVVGMTSFTSVTLYNRAYITPHNMITGLAGGKVYVYSGSGTARAAAGVAPSGFSLSLAESVISGNCEAGTKLVGVCFETASGFLTAPGGFASLTLLGGKKLNVGLLPIGPAGTVARVLVCSKSLVGDFNGDFVHQTYLFVPNGRIADNSTVTLNNTLSFYDADLEEDASYLLDQLDEIPAGVGIGNYAGRMIVWGEDANQSIVRASKSGQPESFDATEGFATINPGDNGNGLKRCWEYRGQLICQKSNRTYTTQDNGENAAFWNVPPAIDDSIGTEPHGVGQVLDFGNNVADQVLVAHSTGVRFFTGSFNTLPLTFNVDNIWKRINKAAFQTIECCINPFNFELFIAIPLDTAVSPSHVLYGDYSQGMTAEGIRWDLWSFPRAPRSIVADIDNTTKAAIFKYGTLIGNVYKMDTTQTTDFGTAIIAYARQAYVPGNDQDDIVRHFGGCRIRVKGSGTLRVVAYGPDDVLSTANLDITLAMAPGKPIFQGFVLEAERCSIKLSTVNANDSYSINKLSVLHNPLWEQR